VPHDCVAAPRVGEHRGRNLAREGPRGLGRDVLSGECPAAGRVARRVESREGGRDRELDRISQSWTLSRAGSPRS